MTDSSPQTRKPIRIERSRGERSVSWNGFSDCHTCAVRQSALFAHMSEADFAAIHYPIDEIRLRPGALLYDNGERADYLFTVRSGALKIEHEGASGQRRVTAMMVRGDLIGLSAYVLGNYDGRVVALTDAMVCRLPIASLRELERGSPGFMQGMQEKWHSTLVLTHAWLTDIGMGSVRERLARLLLRFPIDADGATPLCTRRELGLLLGDVALETISRQMTALRAEGVLEFIDARGRQVRIDRDKLAEVANLNRA